MLCIPVYLLFLTLLAFHIVAGLKLNCDAVCYCQGLGACRTFARPALRCELDNNGIQRGAGRYLGIPANVLLEPRELWREKPCVHTVCVTGRLIGLQAVKQIDWIGSRVHLSLRIGSQVRRPIPIYRPPGEVSGVPRKYTSNRSN